MQIHLSGYNSGCPPSTMVLQRVGQIIGIEVGRVEVQGKLADLLKASREMQRLWHRQAWDKEVRERPGTM